MYRITVRDEKGDVRTEYIWDERKESITLGRDPNCDVRLNYPQSSREHCRLERSGEEVYLEDLDSLNGTLYEGTDIDRTAIEDHDLFQIENWSVEIKPRKSTRSVYEEEHGEEDATGGEEEKKKSTSATPSVSSEDDEDTAGEKQEDGEGNGGEPVFEKNTPQPSTSNTRRNDEKGARRKKKRSSLGTFLTGLLYSAILTVIGAAVGSTVTIFLLKNPDIEILGYDLNYRLEKELPEKPEKSSNIADRSLKDLARAYYRRRADRSMPITDTGHFLNRYQPELLDSLNINKNYELGKRRVIFVSFTAGEKTYRDVIWFRTTGEANLVSSPPPAGGTGRNSQNVERYFFGKEGANNQTDRRKMDKLLNRERSWLTDGNEPPWREGKRRPK